ncbi:winged helix-turn-helix transcriptional regulator [Candidatus Woesearchaeota archaeon]|nr:winged helix-turn-helix transcriptional regulator [Candidatus Woesearchaeota archaeon]
MVKEILQSLGLTKNEVEIYITLLTEGESSVNQIATKSGLYRQVCYDALDRLLEKGFVSYILKKHKKYFKALEPEKITDYLEEKKKELNSILPKLKDMSKVEKSETEVETIKGKAVLKTICSDIIKELKEKKQKTLFSLGVDISKSQEFDKIAYKQYILRLKENKFKEKLLAKENAEEFPEGPQVECKVLPEHLFRANPTSIYGDKVAIIVWGAPTYGIIIKNKEVAEANRKYFEVMWQRAKKIKS